MTISHPTRSWHFMRWLRCQYLTRAAAFVHRSVRWWLKTHCDPSADCVALQAHDGWPQSKIFADARAAAAPRACAMPFAAPRMKVGKGLSAAFRRTTLGWRRGPGSDHTASTP
ncbi:hypothetical protein GQF56_15580 [Rhodobacter sphaeroides]|uniref:Uncharacterized protein n=1 Tax=Cereibacter sphaeroides (strain ATCC 17023 / DSM 158 / JCM 6121 / CCUG 31486 / LMG 2827 / NBRC 12203 / NCIMB 8253 / ATH 2.4.1.) TaxID=272943 RepID=Q3IVS5_CERS4|nr:hypothetical protein RSP_3753 [Cereibacter sphaeroides 2.4.1]AXC63650.1 hypothetical protein DQL45_19945 [Cereibacter sphaeroides 2.4.1]MVX49272.1 hypothetical protein [Cereibacter sphaeroides]